MKIFNGICGLLASQKGVMSLLMTLGACGLCYLGKLDGGSLVAILTIMSGIFHVSHTVTDCVAMKQGNKNE